MKIIIAFITFDLFMKEVLIGAMHRGLAQKKHEYITQCKKSIRHSLSFMVDNHNTLVLSKD